MKCLILLFIIVNTISCTKKTESSYKGFGSESISNEVLKKFPPVAKDKALVAKIHKALDIRSTNSQIVTNDGKRLFFIWSVTGVSQVWRLDGPNSFPIQMTSGADDTSLRGITADDKWLILSRDKAGDEYPGIYLQSTEGGPLTLVYRKTKVQASPLTSSADSKYLYFKANDIKPDSYAFYRYEILTGKTELILNNKTGIWSVSDFYQKQNKMLVINYRGAKSTEIFILDLQSKDLQPILGQKEDAEYQAAFSNDPNQLIILTNKFGNYRRLYTYDILSKKFTPITPEANYDIEYFTVERKPWNRIIFEYNRKGYSKFKTIGLNNYKKVSSPELPNGLQQFYGRTSKNGRYTSFILIKAKSPSESYVYDWKNQKLTQWTKSSSPEISTKNFVTPVLEHYVARDGTKIPMFVRRPDKCKTENCPVIVNFHGGPAAQSVPFFYSIFQFIVDEGFIFVRPNVRGSDGYGKQWLHSDDGPKRLNVITDIEDAALWIKKNWSKNGKAPKIGVVGGSYGGYSVYMAMTKFAGSYDAGIAIVGMSDLKSFLLNTATYRRKHRISEYGDPEKDAEALKKLSAMTYIDNIKDPLLIIHGATDPRVPAGEAIQIYDRLKSENHPVEMMLFPNEGHGIRKKTNRAISYARQIEFFNKYLK